MAKRTPLYEEHLKQHGKMVEYGGWELPVEYGGILKEHEAVRARAGLFDVSHMGRFMLSGPGATEWLEGVITNTLVKAPIGRCVYSPVCYEDGGTVDDVIAYRRGEDDWMIVVNAANRDKDFAHFQCSLPGGVTLSDASDDTAQVALQGPLAMDIAGRVLGGALTELKGYRFLETGYEGQDIIISRTGYTGEDGVEVYMPRALAGRVWNALLSAGEAEGLVPCGLGARDLLRFEACMPLYGHELSADISPLEAGLHKFVKLDKPAFAGREALMKQPPWRGRIGLKMLDRGIAREGYLVYCGDERVGEVTSGSMSPSAGGNFAMALVDANFAAQGRYEIEIRGRRVAAEIAPMPFYKRNR